MDNSNQDENEEEPIIKVSKKNKKKINEEMEGESEEKNIIQINVKSSVKKSIKKSRSKKLIGEDYEASYAYVALLKLHITPIEWCKLKQREKAFIIASLDIYREAKEKEAKEIKARGKH